MIYYFYGKEKFLNQKKAQECIEKYKNKYPMSLGLYVLNEENFLPDEMESAVKTLSIFGENKLIVLNNIQDFTKENLDVLVNSISSKDLIKHPNIFLIFTSEVLSKRAFGSKKISKSKSEKISNPEKPLNQTHELFKILEGLPSSSKLSQSSKQSTDLTSQKIRAFAEEEANKLGLNLNPRFISLLLQASGDISTIANNLAKLSNFQTKTAKPISENDFLELVGSLNALDENSIFNAIDAIASGHASSALNIFYNILQKDDKEIFNIWGMLGYFLRNLIIVRSLLDEGNRKEEIIKKSGLKPFVVQKYMEFSKNLKIDQILNLHTFLTDMDIKIKTGQIDGQTALDLFVSRFVSAIDKKY